MTWRRWLWAAAVGSLLAGSPGGADAPEQPAYVGLKKCKTCHGKELYGDQVSPWREGEHAGAFESLASDKAIEYARGRDIAGPPQEADECLECHVTGHGVDARLIKYDLKASDGVQCESCHGPGSDYRKRSIMSDRDESIANGMIPLSTEVCETCHNDRSPAWDPESYTRSDGTKVGFDYEQAKLSVNHPIPEERRGKIDEIEKKLKAEGKKSR
jgi:hypothetical protein